MARWQFGRRGYGHTESIVDAKSEILFWIEPLLTTPLTWQTVGSANGIRVMTQLRDGDKRSIGYLNLVTAIAAIRGRAFHSADYHSAAAWLGMPDAIASVLVRAGDNNLPASHPHFVPLARLVARLTVA